MTTTLSIPNTSALVCCDAIVDAVDAGASNGNLVIYDGTVPTNVDTALSGNTVLATLPCSDPAFGAAADIAPGARATAAAITAANAVADGTATFFRFLDSDGTPRIQGTCGTSGEALNLNTTSILTGVQVSVSSFTVTVPE